VDQLFQVGISELAADASLVLDVCDPLETHRCYDDDRYSVAPTGVAKPAKQLP